MWKSNSDIVGSVLWMIEYLLNGERNMYAFMPDIYTMQML
jgi:hypothetical protein